MYVFTDGEYFLKLKKGLAFGRTKDINKCDFWETKSNIKSWEKSVKAKFPEMEIKKTYLKVKTKYFVDVSYFPDKKAMNLIVYKEVKKDKRKVLDYIDFVTITPIQSVSDRLLEIGFEAYKNDFEIELM